MVPPPVKGHGCIAKTVALAYATSIELGRIAQANLYAAYTMRNLLSKYNQKSRSSRAT
jgi:hypothetical protein